MRYFLLLEYKGTRYKGWQRQPGAITVQQIIEEAFERLLQCKVFVIGCGRTDSGVHASGYVAHIDVAEPLGDSFLININNILPDDITIQQVKHVDKSLHAQYSAMWRRYDFNFHTIKSSFLAETSTYIRQPLLYLDSMKKCADTICNYNDFSAFCLTPGRHDSTVCSVKRVDLKWNDNATRFCFTITGNRFLRGMVRILAGKIIEVGSGRMSVEQFEFHLANCELFKHKNMTFPQGLFLTHVEYPDEIFSNNLVV